MARVTTTETNKAVGGAAGPASQAIAEALTVFRDGTIDEAKVLIARLDEMATTHPDNKVAPRLKEHVMAVFRAEHSLTAREETCSKQQTEK